MSSSFGGAEDDVGSGLQARRLELSLRSEDGSLVTASLASVLNATTQALYADLHAMANGELSIASASLPTTEQQGAIESSTAAASASTPTSSSAQQAPQYKQQSMASLSFAQRRHELSVRMAHHSKSVAHVSALVRSYTNVEDGLLPACVKVSSEALQHARAALREADEAQDALYFHHAELWKARRHAHDVFGAMEVTLRGTFDDMPKDICLHQTATTTHGATANKSQTVDRLQSCIRRKLLLGEVGFGVMTNKNQNSSTHANVLPWKVSLEKGGGVVRLTHGDARGSKYPMEARVTVLSESKEAEWTLLSVEVMVAPMTGERSHQLELTNRQRFDLHRIAARCMAVEEASIRHQHQQIQIQEQEQTKETSPLDTVLPSKEESTTMNTETASNGNGVFVKGVEALSDGAKEDEDANRKNVLVARPLDSLFEVAHTFSLSLQLELLSAQADALRKGSWSTSGGRGAEDGGIVVTPVHFYPPTHKVGATLAVMAIHFWAVDDRYGPPTMGDLLTTTTTSTSSSSAVDSSASVASTKSGGTRLNQRLGHLPQTPEHNARAARRLCLSIRAVVRTGIIVSISGGDGIASALSGPSKSSHHLRRNYEKMLNHASNPFELSASNALLAVTVMCAERRCDAVVQALHHEMDTESSTLGTSVGRLARTRSLPDWMRLSVECGTVSVAAQIISHGDETNDVTNEEPVVILFRLACDSRTGRFVPVFPRTTGLLRKLACNSSAASDVHALRQAAAASSQSSKRRTTNSSNKNAFKDLTGRIVRDSFDGLSRSMDILARRAGIGGGWQDNDKDASKLRQRAVESACEDVRTSLMTCCGIAAVYGIGAIALGVASGVDASADIAGGIMDHKSTGSSENILLSIPPVGILLNQSLAEKKVGDANTQDDLLDETRKVTIVEREVLALTGSVNDSALTLHCFDVTAQLDSPSSVPVRTQCIPVSFESVVTVENGTGPAAKRARLDSQSTTGSSATNYQMMDKVQQLAAQLQNTLRRLTE